MKLFRLAFALAALAGALVCAPAVACSVTNDYRVPTNLELAGEASSILLARVVGGHDDPDNFAERKLTIRPVAAIKGPLPESDLELPGMTLASGEMARFGVLSNPYEFEEAHPVSYIGACIRRIFPLGTTALFFLDRRDGKWVSAGGPFSRWAEDVPAQDAPWVALTRLYVRAGAMAEQERRIFLGTELEKLRARSGDPVAQLMAADIERQLTGPNESWNAMMERALGLSQPEAMAEKAGRSVEETLETMRSEEKE